MSWSQALQDELASWRLRSRFRIPLTESALLAEIHRIGHVLELRYEGDSAIIVAHVPPQLEQTPRTVSIRHRQRLRTRLSERSPNRVIGDRS